MNCCKKLLSLPKFVIKVLSVTVINNIMDIYFCIYIYIFTYSGWWKIRFQQKYRIFRLLS